VALKQSPNLSSAIVRTAARCTTKISDPRSRKHALPAAVGLQKLYRKSGKSRHREFKPQRVDQWESAPERARRPGWPHPPSCAGQAM
jgi:hypothetical protein